MQKKRLFSVENVLLCDKNNGQCLACVHPIWDALGYLGGQLGPLHMSPVDRAGSVSSYGDFQPAFRDEKFEKVVMRPFRREI